MDTTILPDPSTLDPFTADEARGWLADCGYGGAYSKPMPVIIAAVHKYYEGGWAAFIVNCG